MRKNLTLLVGGVAAATAAVAVAAAAPAQATPTAPAPTPAGYSPSPTPAVFVQTDGLHGNAVVAYDRRADGTLSKAGTYATGGLGGQLDGSVVDHVASQGSLTYDSQHRLLYAVNPGSNTVTVFAVIGDRLVRTQVVNSGGNFPVSVAARGNTVYVLNARSGGSVQGFFQIAGHLFPVPGWNRALGLDPSQTPEFTSTPGQVAFTPNGRQLVVTTKGNGSSIDVFPLGFFGDIGRSATVNPVPGAVPFGVAFDAAGRLVVAEAGTNSVATYSIDEAGHTHAIDSEATGQAATCWVTRVGGDVYAANAGSGTLSAYGLNADGSLTAKGNTATDAGSVDVAGTPDGRFLYAQTGAAGTVVQFRRSSDGTLTKIGQVTVPDSIGAEGIVAV